MNSMLKGINIEKTSISKIEAKTRPVTDIELVPLQIHSV